MNKEENTVEDNIKEVMGLVEYVEKLADDWRICVESSLNPKEIEIQLKDARSNIESKLRALIAEAYREGYTNGCAEAQEYL